MLQREGSQYFERSMDFILAAAKALEAAGAKDVRMLVLYEPTKMSNTRMDQDDITLKLGKEVSVHFYKRKGWEDASHPSEVYYADVGVDQKGMHIRYMNPRKASEMALIDWDGNEFYAFQVEDPETIVRNGGIDTADQFDLQTKSDGDMAMGFNIDPAQLQILRKASGFSPVIRDIQPMDDLPQFLGLASAE